MIAPPKNPNYAAIVVSLTDFVSLPNCDNIQAAIIFGYSVIVSKQLQSGDVGLFFPAETQLSHAFLAANNLYRKPEFRFLEQESKLLDLGTSDTETRESGEAA